MGRRKIEDSLAEAALSLAAGQSAKELAERLQCDVRHAERLRKRAREVQKTYAQNAAVVWGTVELAASRELLDRAMTAVWECKGEAAARSAKLAHELLTAMVDRAAGVAEGAAKMKGAGSLAEHARETLAGAIADIRRDDDEEGEE